MGRYIRGMILIAFIGITLCILGIEFINKNMESNTLKNATAVSNESVKIKPSDNIKNSNSSKNNSVTSTKNSNTKVNNNDNKNNKIADNNNNSYDDTHSFFVAYDDYSAVVSLDKDTKEIKISDISENSKLDHDDYNVDNYINLNNSNLDKYSLDELQNLKEEFLTADIFKKYSIAKDILSGSDTDITISDMINIYSSYFATNIIK